MTPDEIVTMSDKIKSSLTVPEKSGAYMVVEFSADDGGYSCSAEILSKEEATELCKTWCHREHQLFTGLKDYEVEDVNGFFYSFKVSEAKPGAQISTGQYR